MKKFKILLLCAVLGFTIPQSQILATSITANIDSISSDIRNLNQMLHPLLTEENPQIIEQFETMTREWQEYYLEKRAFDIQLLIKATKLLIAGEAERITKNEDSSLVHVLRITHILWSNKVRSVNILAAALLDHIDEVGVSENELQDSFGPRIYYTLYNEEHPPTQTEEEHRNVHIQVAPLQTINAQMIQLAHRIEYFQYKLNLDQISEEELLVQLKWSRSLLHALHGANENLENALQEEIDRLTSTLLA